jgi:hypothetical protein
VIMERSTTFDNTSSEGFENTNHTKETSRVPTARALQPLTNTSSRDSGGAKSAEVLLSKVRSVSWVDGCNVVRTSLKLRAAANGLYTLTMKAGIAYTSSFGHLGKSRD